MECSTNARLLFIGLWNFCDDKGRHNASVKQLKAEVFPADDLTNGIIKEWIGELISNGLLIEYEGTIKEEYCDRSRLIWQVTGWNHQRIDKPQPSKLPAPASRIVLGAVAERSESVPAGRDRIVKDSNGLDTYVAVSEWNELASRLGLPTVQRMSKSRVAQLRRRMIECGGMDGWKAALEKIEASPFLTGDNNNGWKAKFDWVIKESNFTKIMEGNYKPAARSQATESITERAIRLSRTT